MDPIVFFMGLRAQVVAFLAITYIYCRSEHERELCREVLGEMVSDIVGELEGLREALISCDSFEKIDASENIRDYARCVNNRGFDIVIESARVREDTEAQLHI